MLGCFSLTLSTLDACASMGLQQHMLTTLYCQSIQEHSSLCVSRQSKYFRTVHVTSIPCRSSNTRCIHLDSTTLLQSQSGNKWKSFEMHCQILKVQTPHLSRVEPTKSGLFAGISPVHVHYNKDKKESTPRGTLHTF